MARLTRALLWAVLGVWLVVGLTWAALQFFIVPRINDWRGELQAQATRAVGVPVRIGHIAAHTQGLVPSFELSGVRLLDAQGRDALVLGRVIMSVSARSLLRLGLEQIHIDQPTLDVRRTTEGRLLVAGLDVLGTDTDPDADNPVADWFFAQTEFAIRSGTLRWTDDLHQRPPLSLTEVDLVVRNPGRQHLLRLSATPQDGLGQRFTLQGVFSSPFWSLHPGRWSQWSGTAHAELPAVDVARLSVPTSLFERFGLHVERGVGALRVWMDVKDGLPTGGTADLALTGVQARFAKANQPLALSHLQGRLTVALGTDTLSLDTTGLGFQTEQGTRWARGDVSLKLAQHADHSTGELRASHINLGALNELSNGLPLAPAQQARLAELNPTGELAALTLAWRTEDGAWSRFNAQGKVTQLALAPGPVPPPAALAPGGTPRPQPGRPGLAGATVDFDFNQSGGQAKVGMGQGWLSFPGVFEDPHIPMDQLSGDVRWQLKGQDIRVQVARLRLANADLQGQASAQWRTSDPATSPSGGRFPGVLKLEGTLTRAKAERVHRYLPLVIGPVAKDYVKEALLGGRASHVRFRVAGELWEVPFPNPADGDLNVVAQLSGVDFAFVPPSLTPAGEPHWPALRQVAGELVFDRTSMTVSVARGSVADAPALRVSQGKAHIANLMDHAVVDVHAQVDGPLSQALDVVRRSPLSAMTAQALNHTTGTGQADIQFGLSVPLHDTHKTQVKGRITLPGNDVRLFPASPVLAHMQAAIDFTDTGFQVAQATAQMLGGGLSFTGGLRLDPSGSGGVLQFSGQGTATAAGLAQAPYLGLPTALLARSSGSSAYTVQLGFRHGLPEWSVQSQLQGLALDLPAPLRKTADQPWPFQYASKVDTPAAGTQAARETVRMGFAPDARTQANATFDRTLSDQGAVLQRGVVSVGPRDAPVPGLPTKGLSAHLTLPTLDADAWLAVLDTPAASMDNATGTADTPGHRPPDSVQLDTGLLRLGGRSFHQLSLNAHALQSPTDGTRPRWRATVQAQELAGTLTYQPPHPQGATHTPGAIDTRDGQVVARLQRLSLSTATETPPATPSTPGADTTRAAAAPTLPALDVAVEDFELDGRDLGQLNLEATNRATGSANAPREWLLHRLVLRVPEAQLSASGSWALPTATERTRPGPASTSPAAPAGDLRRTDLQVALDIEDSGALLQRFGMPGVFRGGKGSLKGSLGWQGMPGQLHIPSMGGQLKLDLAAGQFLKADPGLAKLLGVLSLQSLPRRLTLDFSDVFAQGFAFDFVRGDARIEQGVIHTQNLQMKGPNAAVLMEGQADIARETQNIRAVVVPELNAGTASLIATVINPAVGLGSMLAQMVLRQPLMAASSQTFLVHGPWADPQVDKITARPEDSAPSPTPNPR